MPTKSWIEVPIDQEIEDVCDAPVPYFFPTEGGTTLFQFTEAEFTQVLSALINGAALTYPENWLQVVWYVLRNVECPVPFCEQIINCIMTDEDTRTSIINMLLNNPEFVDGIKDIATGINPVSPGKIVNPIVESCDKDVLFGAITSIVTTMNRVNEDAFEIMEQATNDEERIALLVEAIPGLGEIIPAELIDLAQQLVENMQENYSAEWTTVVEDKIRMDLLCRAEKNCEITLAMIYDYFNERIGASLTIGTAFTSAIEFLATGDFPGAHIVNFAFMLQLVALRGGSEFFGVSLYTVDLQAQLGANNPNNDWTLLEEGSCPEEETECYDVVYHASQMNYLEGENSNVSVRKGQLIKITVVGTYEWAPGLFIGPDGSGSGDSGSQLPSALHLAFIAKIGPGGQWHDIGAYGEFIAENDGTVYMNVNEQKQASHYHDNTGTLAVEICIPPLPIVLQKTAENYKLEFISENDSEPMYEAEVVYTGHYVVFYAVEINSTTFYIKAIHIINPDTLTDDNGKLGMGLGNVQAWFNLYEVPRDFGSTILSIQNLTAGTKIRFTLTTEAGTVGLFVPVTTGALP